MKNIEPKMSVDTFKYVQLASWKPETNVLMCVTEMVPKRNCATWIQFFLDLIPQIRLI